MPHSPVGLFERNTDNERYVHFKNVAENTEHILLVYAPGFLFNYELVETKASHERARPARRARVRASVPSCEKACHAHCGLTL